MNARSGNGVANHRPAGVAGTHPRRRPPDLWLRPLGEHAPEQSAAAVHTGHAAVPSTEAGIVLAKKPMRLPCNGASRFFTSAACELNLPAATPGREQSR